jgi:tRNA dimethylallyltransferase
MSHLLSLVGPTATGKTQFALQLNEVIREKCSSLHLISADSRQVYKGMEITTGVDRPAVLPFNTHLYGSSLVKPTEEWSVAHFQKYVQGLLPTIWQENGLAVLVGGTGLYSQQLFVDDPQLTIPPNEEVRQRAAQLPLLELQKWLEEINSTKWAEMNTSDRQNPRRLVRAIEVSLAPAAPIRSPLSVPPQLKMMTIGLIDSIEHIEHRIMIRVEERLRNGSLEEVQQLMANYTEQDWQLPAFSATGIKEMRAYLENKIDREEMIQLWQKREAQYAKRQLTWWKKELDIHWFHIDQPAWQEEAKSLVHKWLST